MQIDNLAACGQFQWGIEVSRPSLIFNLKASSYTLVWIVWAIRWIIFRAVATPESIISSPIIVFCIQSQQVPLGDRDPEMNSNYSYRWVSLIFEEKISKLKSVQRWRDQVMMSSSMYRTSPLSPRPRPAWKFKICLQKILSLSSRWKFKIWLQKILSLSLINVKVRNLTPEKYFSFLESI